MPRIFFTAYDSMGAPLEGLAASITWPVFRRVNADGSTTDLTPPAAEDVVDEGDGDYHADVDSALVLPGTALRYRIDKTVAASPRYLDGAIDETDVAQLSVAGSASRPFDLELKRGDLRPVFEQVLRDRRGLVDLTGDGVTVRFRMRLQGSDVLSVDAGADIVDADRSLVRYAWQGGDTAVAGLYDAEFEVSNGPQTLPSSLYFSVKISDSLA